MKYRSNRITVDLSDEPEVFARLIRDAKAACRAVGAQLKFECLPSLRASTKPKRSRPQTNLNHA